MYQVTGILVEHLNVCPRSLSFGSSVMLFRALVCASDMSVYSVCNAGQCWRLVLILYQ